MNELTYTERAGKLSKRTRKAACAKAGKAWKAAQHTAENIGDLEIKVVNSLRQAGEYINLAAGREQLLFNLQGREFCRKELLPLLPPGMGMEQVQACVHIANSIRTGIETREELRVVKQELQLAFQALGLIDAPRRKELQSAHARDLFCDFVSRALGIKTLCDELEKEEPMETWPDYKLDDFLYSARPLKEKIERAERLRLVGAKP